MKIEYSKKTVKYINSVDKPTKKRLRVELVPEEDVEVLYKVIVKFIPEAVPEPDEIEAILEGRKDRAKNGTVSHDAINWD